MGGPTVACLLSLLATEGVPSAPPSAAACAAAPPLYDSLAGCHTDQLLAPLHDLPKRKLQEGTAVSAQTAPTGLLPRPHKGLAAISKGDQQHLPWLETSSMSPHLSSLFNFFSAAAVASVTVQQAQRQRIITTCYSPLSHSLTLLLYRR